MKPPCTGSRVGRWRGFRRPVVTALIAATAAVALTGCGAAGASGDDDEHAAAEESSLPPGVMPPNDPPQPGDAPLGPDGHYDYSAPDFVLKNPCETDAYQVALQNGWEPPVVGKQFKDYGTFQHCGITKEGTGISIYSHSLSFHDIEELSSDLRLHEDQGLTWHTAVVPGQFGDSCLAGAMGPGGGFGINIGMGAFSFYNSRDEACGFATQQFKELFRGE